MSENLVRDVHDALARSDSVVQASARPSATTPRELRAMERDVLRKLRLGAGTGVVEIGCGIALLGVPVARRAARYVGLDFAPQAVETARERLRTAGLEERSRVLCMDVFSVGGAELDALGRFERVLMYAVFHYARTESEAVCLLQRAFDLLAPGGQALIGNVPLSDLHIDWRPPEPGPERTGRTGDRCDAVGDDAGNVGGAPHSSLEGSPHRGGAAAAAGHRRGVSWSRHCRPGTRCR